MTYIATLTRADGLPLTDAETEALFNAAFDDAGAEVMVAVQLRSDSDPYERPGVLKLRRSELL